MILLISLIFSGDCAGYDNKSGRVNANGKDLNRDFPDQFDADVQPGTDSAKLVAGRQPETIALMTWIVSRPFVLSANLHGGKCGRALIERNHLNCCATRSAGAVVASYPFDDSADHTESGKLSPAPDHPLFKHLALTYARNHPTMRTGHVCLDDNFDQGITNGAHWFDVPGKRD